MDPLPEKKTPHILVLDDDKAHQELCLRAFRDDPELVRVSVAGSIREAKNILDADPADLIIADWVLPEGKGLEILPRRDGIVTVPLIIMTSHGDEQLAVEIMKSGAIDYVVKSATMFRELPHIARRALRDWENIRTRRLAEDAAREAQKRVADIIGFLPDAVFAIDTGGRVIAWNRAIEEMTGVPAGEMIGKGDHEYSIPFYGERRPILIDLCLMEDAEVEKKYEFIRRDGDRITSETFIPSLYGGKGAYLWGTATRLYDARGEMAGAIEVIRDISDRKQNEKYLRESEEKYRNLAENVHDGIYIYDGSSHFLFVNHRAAEISGYTEEELLSMNILDIVHPDDRPFISDIIAKRFGGCTAAETYEVRIIRKDGIIRVLEISVSCISYRGQFATLGAARDITERKRAEETLQNREATLETLLNAPHDTIALLDRQGIILGINTEGARRLGGSPAEITGRCAYDLLPPDVAATRRIAIAGVFTTGTSAVFDDERSGRFFHNEVYPIYNPDHTAVERIAIFARDVTEQRRVEAALRMSEKNLSRAQAVGHIGSWEWDPVGNRLAWSDELYRIFGVSRTFSLTYENIVSLIHPEDRERNDRVVKDVLATGTGTEYEFRIVRPDGTERFVLQKIEVTRDEQGSPQTVFGIIQDISGQKEAQAALARSETRFRELFDNMGAGVAVYAVTGNGDEFVFRDINRAVERIEHVRREDVIGRNVREVFPGVEEFGLLDVFRRVSRSGIAESHPVTQYRDDRIAGWRENYVYKLPSGEIVAIYEDVTDKKQAEEAAAEAREWLGMALRAAKAGTWDWDMATGTLTWSPEFYELFGIPPGTPATFESWLAALHPDDRTPAMARIDQSVKDHTYLWNEYRIVLPDGTIRWIGAGGTTVYSPEDKPVRMSGVCIDISALKQAEERLRAQGQILDQMYEGVCMVRARDNTIVYTNPRFNIMFGYAPGELDGREIAIINAPVEGRTPGDVAEAIRAQLVEKGVWSGEVQNIRKDGTTVHCQASVSAFVHPQFGQVWIAVHEDITKRKQAEEALRQSEVRYRTLTETVPDIIARFDQDHRHIFLNAAIGKVTGHSPEFYYGKTNRDIGMPEDLVAYWDGKLDQVFASGRPDTLEFVYSTAGEDRFFESRLVPEFSPEGQVISVVSIARDVTDRKRAQAALEKSRIQLDDAMDLAHIVYWELDVLSGTFTFNDRFYALYATTAEREGGYTMAAAEYAHRFIPADEQNLVAMETQKAVETDDPHYVALIEHRIIRRDGAVRTIIVRYSVVKDAEGRTIRTYGANQDITERKAAERDREQYAARLNSAMEIGNLAWWEMDLPDGTVRFDPRKATMLGYPPENFRHYSDFTALLHPDDYEPAMQAMRDHIGGKDPRYRADYRIRMADGNYRWFRDVGGITKRHTDGSPATLTGIVIDITAGKKAEEALVESEKKFRIFADYTFDWEYWIRPDGTFQYISPSCERITGYTPEEFSQDPDLLKKIVHSDDQLRVFSHYDAGHKDDDAEESIEFRIITKDGHTVWIGHVCHPLVSADGTYLGRRGSNRDITIRKQTEAELLERETRFRALIQNSSDIIRILDGNGLAIYESPSAARILGYPPGYMIGRDPMDLIHPEDIGRVHADLRQVYDRTNSGTPVEFRIRKADGDYLWVDAIGTNLLDVPAINGIVITTRPIQLRKEAEEALHESEERLRLALEGADIASWDWDLKTGNAVFSDTYYTMLGYEPGEFPATYEGWSSLMHPDDREKVLPDLKRQIEQKQALCEIEYRVLAKDGNWLWILGRGKIAGFDEHGIPARMTGINIDITNRRLMESEIRSLNTVLEQRVKDRTEALSRANEAHEEENAQRLEAEQKLRASVDEKSLLLKEIHHRVKNNLQIIASLLNLQSRYIKDEQTLNAIRESQNRVKAMALVHEKLYRAEDISHISLEDYVKYLANGLFQFYDAKTRGIRLSLDIREVNVDINSAIPLGLIINELISNSLKYAFPEGRKGEISISMRKTGPDITVVFRDTGIGLPADLDWQNTPSLGLRLVTTLVDQMNGTIELDGSGGTKFTMIMHEKV